MIFSLNTIPFPIKSSMSVLVLALTLTGCASKPIVDTQGIDQAQYEEDLKQCQALADQVNSGAQTGKSAMFGALVGAAYGAITGNTGQGAAIGGVTGATSGAGGADAEKAKVLRNCLNNRGYTVLN